MNRQAGRLDKPWTREFGDGLENHWKDDLTDVFNRLWIGHNPLVSSIIDCINKKEVGHTKRNFSTKATKGGFQEANTKEEL